MAAVAVEHAGQLDGQGPTDAMGDQKRAELRLAHLALEHQIHGCAGLLACEAGAGVLTTAHLADQLAKAGPLRAEGLQLLVPSEGDAW
jgi:hypothetical protein